MEKDISEAPSLTEAVGALDAMENLKGCRRNASALRRMFGTCSAEEKSVQATVEPDKTTTAKLKPRLRVGALQL
jgi:hypothetical protein